jgi:GTP cyclohydrolase I
VPCGYLVGHYWSKLRVVTQIDEPWSAHVIIDDLIDSGKTRYRFKDKVFGSLFLKNPESYMPEIDPTIGPTFYGQAAGPGWLVFPWEATETGSGEDIVLRMLQFIGEDPQRGGLKETPARVLKAWRDEWFSGYGRDPKDVLKAFEDGAEKYDEMIVVRGIPIYTHCEHHLAPFFGEAHVAYVPDGRIVGLSKLARLVDIFARRLQVQERLTAQIADAIMDNLGAKGAGVVLTCRHLCMESRGIQKPGTSTVTSVMRGVMLTKPEARIELLSLIKS